MGRRSWEYGLKVDAGTRHVLLSVFSPPGDERFSPTTTQKSKTNDNWDQWPLDELSVSQGPRSFIICVLYCNDSKLTKSHRSEHGRWGRKHHRSHLG